MVQMVVASLGYAFGLTGSYPVGGFVAGATKAILFHESFEQIQWLVIDSEPVLRYSPGAQAQDLRG